MPQPEPTAYLVRPEGRVAYDVGGAGPLVVLAPGMGDLRAGYRFLTPVLREAGHRIACTDLRGHGDSDTTFTSYGDVETATDIAALIEKLGGPAAGHYPQSQRPDVTNEAILRFLETVKAKAAALRPTLAAAASTRPPPANA
jgi:pimeloyl-ACP methyl ester carboxylesterase